MADAIRSPGGLARPKSTVVSFTYAPTYRSTTRENIGRVSGLLPGKPCVAAYIGECRVTKIAWRGYVLSLCVAYSACLSVIDMQLHSARQLWKSLNVRDRRTFSTSSRRFAGHLPEAAPTTDATEAWGHSADAREHAARAHANTMIAGIARVSMLVAARRDNRTAYRSGHVRNRLRRCAERTPHADVSADVVLRNPWHVIMPVSLNFERLK